jgi:hypothetical protein
MVNQTPGCDELKEKREFRNRPDELIAGSFWSVKTVTGS